jgi:hypothetical protein
MNRYYDCGHFVRDYFRTADTLVQNRIVMLGQQMNFAVLRGGDSGVSDQPSRARAVTIAAIY